MSKHRLPRGAAAIPADQSDNNGTDEAVAVDTEQDEAVAVDTEQVDVEQPDTEQPDTEQPDTEQPDTEQPDTETAAETIEAQAETAEAPKGGISWARVLAFGVLPGLALLLAVGAGYLKWMDSTARDALRARIESVQVATDSTIAMLSYRPDTVERDLDAAQDRLTGKFKGSYHTLTHYVVIPEAKQKRISAVANVPVAASVSASLNHAVVLVFVNQTVVVGAEPPTKTASSVRVTLDKISGRWLISDFTPV